MTLFRIRTYGSAEWTLLSINTPGDEDEESEVADAVTQIVGSALDTSPFHVQKMNDEGDWEDV